MKKSVRLILVFVLVFLLIQLASATDTEIKIKTIPKHEVQLTTYEANIADFVVIQSFKEDSDEYGDIAFTTSTSKPEFNIIVYIKKDNVKIIGPEKFLNNPSGEPIYLEIAPSWFTFINTPINETNTTEEISNETEEVPKETEIIEEENKTTESSVTGLAISNDGFLSRKAFYYGIGVFGFLFISFVAFIVVKRTKSRSKMKGMEKLDDILDQMDTRTKKPKNKRDIMEDVKKKMKDIENEIEELED